MADRKLDDGIETVSMPLPALVTILPDTNTPRIPTLKQVLGAAKKPVQNITLPDLGQTYAPSLQTLATLATTMDRRRLKFGPDPEGIRSIVGSLLKEGVFA
jgi:electron transfer flavoprotein beta subunit